MGVLEHGIQLVGIHSAPFHAKGRIAYDQRFLFCLVTVCLVLLQRHSTVSVRRVHAPERAAWHL
jgi:hypothetical protein